MSISGIRSLCLGGLLILISSGIANALTARADPDNVESLDTQRYAPTNEEAEKWDFQFSSLSEFAQAVRRPTLKVVCTGQTKDFYYVLMRRDNFLYVVDWAKRGSRIKKEDIRVENADGWEQVLLSDTTLNLPATLVKTTTSGPSWEDLRKVQLTYVKVIEATVFTVDPEFHGKIAVSFNVTNDKFEGAEATATFPWEATVRF